MSLRGMLPVTVIHDVYNDGETLVSTRAGDTEYFHVGVGLHQGFISLYTHHGCTTGRDRKVATMGDVVCGWSFVNIVEQKLSCSLRDGERQLSPTDY